MLQQGKVREQAWGEHTVLTTYSVARQLNIHKQMYPFTHTDDILNFDYKTTIRFQAHGNYINDIDVRTIGRMFSLKQFKWK